MNLIESITSINFCGIISARTPKKPKIESSVFYAYFDKLLQHVPRQIKNEDNKRNNNI